MTAHERPAPPAGGALGPIALALAALFAGAALYIHVAEQPARLGLDDQALLAEWRTSYWWAARLQAPLAVAAGVAAILTWRWSGERFWLVGAILMIANLPYTLIIMRAVNGRLLNAETTGPAARLLVEQWGWLHGARTALAFAAIAFFVAALARHPQTAA